MRRRLLVVLIPLLGTLFLGLGVPLAANIAQSETQAVYLDRLADAERFTALADDALRRGRFTALTTELARYDQLYGIAVAIYASDGRQLAASRAAFAPDASEVRDPLATALAGIRPDRIATVWPWHSTSMVVVEPVGRDTGVIAAVVLVSPTGRLRATELRRWGQLGALGIVPFLLAVAVAVQLARGCCGRCATWTPPRSPSRPVASTRAP